MDRGRSINFQGQRSNFKVTGHLQRILALGSLWAGYSENYACSNLVCTLHMERRRNLSFFKVKGQIARSLGLYKDFWHLDPCWQDIARTMWARIIKLSIYTSYGKRKKPIYFQGQRSNFKVTGPLQRILALGSLWAGYSENYAV